MNLNEDIIVHDQLNPKLWENGQLKPEVKSKIMEIVQAFEEYVEVPLSILDVHIVGSNASYNYTDSSDLDVHIIANLEAVTQDTEILQQLYNMKKTNFNSNYDITIHGVAVEVYVQDVRTNVVSNGIYSVCNDTWIKEPKPITNVKNYDTLQEVSAWKQKINQVVPTKDYDQILDVLNALYVMRQNSISQDGEYSKGNQIFKELRNSGHLKLMKQALNDAVSDKLTLEGMSRGTIANRFED